MCCKKCSGLDVIQDILCDCPCNAYTIKCACPPSNLIKKNEAFSGCIVYYIGNFDHLYHKGALTLRKKIRCAYPCEYPVSNPYLCIRCRYTAPNLRHDGYKCNLSHECGFTCHIGPCNY